MVNAGVRRDRDAEIKDFRSAADLGVTHATSNTIATRGERLALTRSRYSHSDEDSEAFSAELLGIVEINADDRIEAWVVFDLDDFDAAIAELDSRYLAGEAAAHAQTWSVITGGHAAVNRRELPPTHAGLRRASTTGAGQRSRPASSSHTSVPGGMSGKTSNLHRDCASIERSWSRLHPCGAWHFA